MTGRIALLAFKGADEVGIVLEPGGKASLLHRSPPIQYLFCLRQLAENNIMIDGHVRLRLKAGT